MVGYGGKDLQKRKVLSLEKEIMQETMPGARRRGRPRTAWMDNIKTGTGLPVEQSIRMTEDGDKRRKYVHGVAHRGRLKNRTDQRPVRYYYLLLLDSQFLFTNRRKANASLRAFSRIWHATKDDLD